MEFRTDRLVIRPFSDCDEEAALHLFTSDVVARTYMLPEFTSIEEAAALFQRLKKLSHTEGRYVSGVYLQGDLIGILNETHVDGSTIELGYAYHPHFYGRGYATETLRGAIAYFFVQGFDTVICGAFETNAASIRVMEKSGMERLQRQEEITYRGVTHCCVYYAACSSR